jgi:hypothetical protein
MMLPLGVVGVRSTGIDLLTATLGQPTDKSTFPNAHHSSERLFEIKEARPVAHRNAHDAEQELIPWCQTTTDLGITVGLKP